MDGENEPAWLSRAPKFPLPFLRLPRRLGENEPDQEPSVEEIERNFPGKLWTKA